MSYSIFVKFIINNKERASAVIDQLKCLCSRRYSADFDDIEDSKSSDHDSKFGDHDGRWYDATCFSKALVDYESKYNEFKEKALKLKLLKETIEYYKLDTDAKQSLDNDISYNDDMAQEYRCKFFACNKMLNIFELFTYDCEDWNFNDKCYAYIYAE